MTMQHVFINSDEKSDIVDIALSKYKQFPKSNLTINYGRAFDKKILSIILSKLTNYFISNNDILTLINNFLYRIENIYIFYYTPNYKYNHSHSIERLWYEQIPYKIEKKTNKFEISMIRSNDRNLDSILLKHKFCYRIRGYIENRKLIFEHEECKMPIVMLAKWLKENINAFAKFKKNCFTCDAFYCLLYNEKNAHYLTDIQENILNYECMYTFTDMMEKYMKPLILTCMYNLKVNLKKYNNHLIIIHKEVTFYEFDIAILTPQEFDEISKKSQELFEFSKQLKSFNSKIT